MGGSNQTTQQGTSESTNEIPAWVQNAGQQNYGLAQQVASQPLQQYQGQMVADVASADPAELEPGGQFGERRRRTRRTPLSQAISTP